MPEADRAVIFDRFGRGRQAAEPAGSQGTGLGLAIVASIAEHHGGSARLVDRPGPGARFEISVPAPAE